jgi:UDP-N-acetylmuramoyl-L-alanyl-D-glutamate--2,6-diaminopimelate ligase
MTKDGLQFLVDGRSFGAEMYGKHNVSNILGVIATARSLEIPWEKIEASVRSFRGVPGRIEFIPEAEEDDGFRVIVDYAFEPKAIAGLYEVVALLKPRKIIHVFGSTGGGRDVSRRFSVGEFVGQHADICIVTDEDPYDDDPMRIIEDVASAVAGTGKKEGETLYKILDRKKAIARAVSMAEEGDLVLITGKGSEQAMCVSGGKKIPWDDREIARGALRRRKMA